MAPTPRFAIQFESGFPRNPYTGEAARRFFPVRGAIREMAEAPGRLGKHRLDPIGEAVLIPRIRQRWPVRTGFSGANFYVRSGILVNRADYAAAVEARRGIIASVSRQAGPELARAVEAELQRIVDAGGRRSPPRVIGGIGL